MLKKTCLILIALAIVVPVAASAKRLPAPVPPPAKTTCVECGMIVQGDNLRFVSEIIFDDGRVKYFCDTGDLLVYYDAHRNKERFAAIYVKDYLTGEWIEGREAAYLSGSRVATPMRYGILVFKDVNIARKFMKERGGDRVYGFKELVYSKIFRR